jgi:Spy/CpxP family protein refolding chaperone
MLKQFMLVLVASGLVATAAPFASAQNSPPSTQTNDQSPSAQEDGGRHHGPPDPAERTRELTKHLKLTSDQQTKVREALDSEHSQMESLHQDTSLSQQDRRSKMMEIRKNTDDQIRGLLDSTQQQKWDRMQANREQRMQNHRGGSPGSGQQNPPPQQ